MDSDKITSDVSSSPSAGDKPAEAQPEAAVAEQAQNQEQTPEMVRTQLLEMGFEQEKIDAAFVLLLSDVGPNPNVEQVINCMTRDERTRLAEEKIKERRAARVLEEQQRAIEEEKKRRESGKQMLKTKDDLQTRERLRVAEEIKREKREKELHKQKVLAQIAADREAQKNKSNPDQATTAPAAPVVSQQAVPSPTKPQSNTAKIAIRLPSGEQLTQEFGASEPLAAVRLWIQIQKADLFAEGKQANFVMPPGKVFSGNDMDTPLKELNLVPSARLILKLV